MKFVSITSSINFAASIKHFFAEFLVSLVITSDWRCDIIPFRHNFQIWKIFGSTNPSVAGIEEVTIQSSHSSPEFHHNYEEEEKMIVLIFWSQILPFKEDLLGSFSFFIPWTGIIFSSLLDIVFRFFLVIIQGLMSFFL